MNDEVWVLGFFFLVAGVWGCEWMVVCLHFSGDYWGEEVNREHASLLFFVLFDFQVFRTVFLKHVSF